MRRSTGCEPSRSAQLSVQQQRLPILPVSGGSGQSSPSAGAVAPSEIRRRAGSVETTPGLAVADYGTQSRELVTPGGPGGPSGNRSKIFWKNIKTISHTVINIFIFIRSFPTQLMQV